MFEKILKILGISYDIAENIRKTDVDEKNNKPSQRHYDFNDGSISNLPTSRKEYKKIKTNKKENITDERDER